MSEISAYGSTASDIRGTYLNLLVTQLRNQNPLDPMDNSQMASQLSQLAQLEQTEKMGATFDKVLTATQMGQAQGMIGQQISFQNLDTDGEEQGTVNSAKILDGEVVLNVSGKSVSLEDILSLGGNSGSFLQAGDLNAATGLIGKEIAFSAETPGGNVVTVTERVTSVELTNGQVLLKAGEYMVPPSAIKAIRE